ncbi:hypothetical protein ABKN59_009200 [Abortiporus biennis]
MYGLDVLVAMRSRNGEMLAFIYKHEDLPFSCGGRRGVVRGEGWRVGCSTKRTNREEVVDVDCRTRMQLAIWKRKVAPIAYLNLQSSFFPHSSDRICCFYGIFTTSTSCVHSVNIQSNSSLLLNASVVTKLHICTRRRYCQCQWWIIMALMLAESCITLYQFLTMQLFRHTYQFRLADEYIRPVGTPMSIGTFGTWKKNILSLGLGERSHGRIRHIKI